MTWTPTANDRLDITAEMLNTVYRGSEDLPVVDANYPSLAAFSTVVAGTQAAVEELQYANGAADTPMGASNCR